MPSLTSCYFCGDAAGASLDEYDLPGAAPADRQVSVTLCAGCYGKLSELLEELQRPGDSSSPVDTAAVDATPAEPSDSGSTAADDPESADADDPTALDPVAGEGEPIFAEDEGALLDEDLPVDGEAEGPFAADRDSQSDDAAAEGAAVDEADRSDDADEDAGGDSDPAESESPSTSDEPSDEPPVDEADERAAPTAEARTDGSEAPTQNAAAEASDGSGEDGTDQRSNGGPLADVSPRTYNRVVRLLQNREFPVDRADFEALATSAYELEQPECAAALDVAIGKGLLEERDGALHRPE